MRLVAKCATAGALILAAVLATLGSSSATAAPSAQAATAAMKRCSRGVARAGYISSSRPSSIARSIVR